MNIQTLTELPRKTITSHASVVFGLRPHELILLGMVLTALATGPWADLKDASELFHWHNIVSACATVGACLVSFATGRMKR